MDSTQWQPLIPNVAMLLHKSKNVILIFGGENGSGILTNSSTMLHQSQITGIEFDTLKNGATQIRFCLSSSMTVKWSQHLDEMNSTLLRDRLADFVSGDIDYPTQSINETAAIKSMMERDPSWKRWND